jgi:hypothetical protein
MESFVLLLEILLPAIVVGAVAYLIIRSYLNYEEGRQSLEIEKSKQDIIFPVRMQAYERITLFLERITPDSLVRRVLKTNTSARLFQSDLIAIIRSEYEHNISQQVYLTANSWSMVKTATEETIRLVNITGSQMPPSATASDLAEQILHITAKVSKFPTQVALEQVKKEFTQYFLKSTT